jgi:hypothetical protein
MDENKRVTYRFAVIKLVHTEDAPDPLSRFPYNKIGGFSDEQEVMSAEIGADEMVELMQHLWDIANRRKNGGEIREK